MPLEEPLALVACSPVPSQPADRQRRGGLARDAARGLLQLLCCLLPRCHCLITASASPTLSRGEATALLHCCCGALPSRSDCSALLPRCSARPAAPRQQARRRIGPTLWYTAGAGSARPSRSGMVACTGPQRVGDLHNRATTTTLRTRARCVAPRRRALEASTRSSGTGTSTATCFSWMVAEQTLSSVGYGNMLPYTAAEWWVACVLVLMSSLLWAFLIGSTVRSPPRSCPRRRSWTTPTCECYPVHASLPAEMRPRACLRLCGKSLPQRALFTRASARRPAQLRRLVPRHGLRGRRQARHPRRGPSHAWRLLRGDRRRAAPTQERPQGGRPMPRPAQAHARLRQGHVARDLGRFGCLLGPLPRRRAHLAHLVRLEFILAP